MGAQASAAATNNMDDIPAVAQFALEVVQLDLEVSVDKSKVSTTSKLRIDLRLVNESSKPFDLLFGVGEIEKSYWLSMVTTAGSDYIPWGSSFTQIYGMTEQIIVIQPGESYEDTYEVDLSKIKDLKTGAYNVDLVFSIVRDIDGELHSFLLRRRSMPFEIVADPSDH